MSVTSYVIRVRAEGGSGSAPAGSANTGLNRFQNNQPDEGTGVNKSVLTSIKSSAVVGAVVAAAGQAYSMYKFKSSALFTGNSGHETALDNKEYSFNVAKSTIGGAAAGMAVGAAIGSIFPGPGTVIGAAAGFVIGGAMAYYNTDRQPRMAETQRLTLDNREAEYNRRLAFVYGSGNR